MVPDLRRRDIYGPIEEMSLEDLEWLINEPGGHHRHRFGWRAIARELIARLRKQQT